MFPMPQLERCVAAIYHTAIQLWHGASPDYMMTVADKLCIAVSGMNGMWLTMQGLLQHQSANHGAVGGPDLILL